MSKDHETTTAEILAFPETGREARRPKAQERPDLAEQRPIIFGTSWYHQEAIDESAQDGSVVSLEFGKR